MRAVHRRLAWIAGLVAVLWAATGFLHPIMSWTAPRPAAMSPPRGQLSVHNLQAPGPLLAAHGWREARGVRLIALDGAPTWLAFGADGRTLALDARTGAPAPDAERAYAAQLARYYAGRPDARIVSAQQLTRFDLFYPSINRVLPIWDMRFADGLAVYVDTRADRLVTMADPLRRFLLFTFQNLHTLQFLSPVEPLRKALILALLATSMASALFGLTMAFRAKGKGARRVHRLIGFIAAPLLLSFGGSGLFHLLTQTPAANHAAASFSVAGLAPPRLIGAAQAVSASADAHGHPLWRVALRGQSLYFTADGAFIALDDSARARILASASESARTDLITHYTDEYGFANKRLPVWRVATGSSARFIDLEEGLIAADAPRGLAAADSWVFNVIHKWRFLDPIGKLKRDLLMMLAVMLIAATSLIGLTLSPKPQTRRMQEKQT